MRKKYIYGLRDPVTGVIRYVGASVNPRNRLSSHLGKDEIGSTKEKREWVQGLLDQNLRPELVILEECDWDEWEEKERWWISSFDNLVNRARGGGGGGTFGMKQSEEWINKRAAALKGNKGRTGQTQSEEERRKRSESLKRAYAEGRRTGGMKGTSVSADSRRKISEGIKESWRRRRNAENS